MFPQFIEQFSRQLTTNYKPIFDCQKKRNSQKLKNYFHASLINKRRISKKGLLLPSGDEIQVSWIETGMNEMHGGVL